MGTTLDLHHFPTCHKDFYFFYGRMSISGGAWSNDLKGLSSYFTFLQLSIIINVVILTLSIYSQSDTSWVLSLCFLVILNTDMCLLKSISVCGGPPLCLVIGCSITCPQRGTRKYRDRQGTFKSRNGSRSIRYY